MKIGNIIEEVKIPARVVSTTREKSEFDKALDMLEIGQGFDYVTGAKDKAGNDVAPNDKAQYSRISSAKWAPEGKTFRVFRAEDQSGVGELEVRYIVSRVDFVEPVVRKKKATAEAAPANEGGEGHETY